MKRMPLQDIYKELQARAHHRAHFFGRKLLVIQYDEFQVFEEYFVRSRNILNRHINFRTRHIFTHIHAIKKGNHVEFHIDYVNPDTSIVMATIHLFIDVIPYFSSRSIRQKKPYSFE